MNQETVRQHIIRDLQSALRTETIRADLLEDKVARLTDQVARLVEQVGRLVENDQPAAFAPACLLPTDPTSGRLAEPEDQCPTSKVASLASPSSVSPKSSGRPSKRQKAGATRSLSAQGTKVSDVVDLRTNPPHPTSPSDASTESESTGDPYKPPPPANPTQPPTTDQLADSPSPTQPAPTFLPASPPAKHYIGENPHRAEDFCTITSVKPIKQKGVLVYVLRLKGQYCSVLLPDGQVLKKLGTCLENIPSPLYRSHAQYDQITDAIVTHDERVLQELNDECDDSEDPTPARPASPPNVQVDSPCPVGGQEDAIQES